MTMNEAIATQPMWISWWLNWLLFGAFILPLALFIWKPTRLAAAITLATGILSAVGVTYLFDTMGYVKLLGLPHVILWTPLVVYLWRVQARNDVAQWPRRIIWVILVTILISLAFDYVDVLRYLLGERTPLLGTGPAAITG